MKPATLSFLMLLIFAVPAYSETSPAPLQATTTSINGPSVISGQIMIRDKTPMNNGVALLYDKKMGAPPHPKNYWRIPDLISGVDKDGRFSITVPDGTYYVMVAQKSPEDDIGPPSGPESLYFHGDSEGNPLQVIVSGGKNVDLGVRMATLWSPDMIQREKGITAAEGVVSDNEGNPVANAAVFAYMSKDAVGRPSFVSDRSDKAGKYQLRVYEGGVYYLKVRSILGGGAPKDGEFLNTTEEFEPVMVTLKKGQITKGVALKVKRFSRPTGSAGKKLRGLEKPDNRPLP
jgi:hypothetical protein